MILCGVAVGLSTLASTLDGAEPDGAFVAKYDRALLRLDTEVTPARSVFPFEGPMHKAGEYAVSVAGTLVVVRRGEHEVWRVPAPDAAALRWCYAQGEVAYFTPGDRGGSSAVERDHVRRLNLSTGQWLPAWTLMHEGSPVGARVEIISADVSRLVVLSSVRGGWLLSAFDPASRDGDAKPMWQTKFAPGHPAESPEDDVALLADRYPDRAGRASPSLLVRKATIVVCDSTSSVVRGFDAGDGRSAWSIENPWEFQRGFTGPSVWQHHVGRFGADIWGSQDDGNVPPERADFESQNVGFVLAGPDSAALGDTFFLAVGRGPRRGYTDYLIEPAIVEIGFGGSAVSVAALPRRPLAGVSTVLGETLVWATQGNGFMGLRSASHDAPVDFGPGGYDHVTDVAWFKTISSPQEGAWIASPSLDGCMDFDDHSVFLASGGTWIADEHDRTVRVGLVRLDLRTLVESRWTLEMPFEGRVRFPASNYRTTLGTKGSRTETLGPFLLGITRITACSGSLILTIGEHDKATNLEFPMPNH